VCVWGGEIVTVKKCWHGRERVEDKLCFVYKSVTTTGTELNSVILFKV